MTRTMMVLRGTFAALSLTAAVASAAASELITFDDIPLAATASQALPSAYAGFDWSGNFSVLNPSGYMPNAGPVLGRQSGSNVAVLALNGGSGGFGSLQGRFDFVSAYLTPATYPSGFVDVQGVRGGTVIYDQRVNLNYQAAELIPFNFVGVDFVSISGAGSTVRSVVLDNVLVNPVPEPESYALLGVGLIGMLLRRRQVRVAPMRA